MKYSYDANGNVEYLLYKNDNFSTAGAYDLYYYVRNATGDITDLFQVRAKSGTSTTAVNRLAAHYEYDPYGNILSINKYNNDPIGDINPIRYRDYYYDLQTGWYQLGSRFYDPEVGRFLNADDVSLLMETDSGVVDKNLYAYCDGNPVMRKDDGGDMWALAFAGAGMGSFSAAEMGTAILAGLASIGPVGWVAIGVAVIATVGVFFTLKASRIKVKWILMHAPNKRSKAVNEKIKHAKVIIGNKGLRLDRLINTHLKMIIESINN